ncbi:hypothetical protein BCU73_008095 [Vibrio cyclitrophicus]|nr:hypothetical protein [Vibrio cyclitrophicus]
MKTIQQDIESLEKSVKQLEHLTGYITEIKSGRFSSQSKILNFLSYRPRDEKYSLRSKPIDLRLIDKTFITQVIFKITNQTNKEVTLQYSADGNSTSITSESYKSGEERVIAFSINSFVDTLTLSSVDGETKISSFKVIGMSGNIVNERSRFHFKHQVQQLRVTKSRLVDTFSRVNKFNDETLEEEARFEQTKETLVALNAKLEEQVESFESQIEGLKEECSSLETTKAKVSSVLAKEKAQLDLSRDENAKLEIQKQDLTNEHSTLTEGVLLSRAQLRQLQSDKDIYSEDLKGYIGETRFQQIFYGAIAFSALAIICGITYQLFERSIELIRLTDTKELSHVWNLILSRIPFTLSIIAIMGAAGASLQMAVNRLIKIHDQRLAFLRLSILSRDITSMATEDLDLSHEEIAQLRIKLKTEFLKSHMEKDLGKPNADSKVTIDE